MAKTATAAPDDGTLRVASTVTPDQARSFLRGIARSDPATLTIGDQVVDVTQVQYGEPAVLTFEVLLEGPFSGTVTLTRLGNTTEANAELPGGPTTIEWSLVTA